MTVPSITNKHNIVTCDANYHVQLHPPSSIKHMQTLLPTENLQLIVKLHKKIEVGPVFVLQIKKLRKRFCWVD